MKRILCVSVLGLLGPFAAFEGRAQSRTYIGYAYPAGGQQGTTFMVKIGGQSLGGLHSAVVSGSGVKAEVLQYHPKLNPQDSAILQGQLRKLRETLPKSDPKWRKDRKRSGSPPRKMPDLMMEAMDDPELAANPGIRAVGHEATLKLIEKIEARLAEYVQRPAVSSIADIVYLKVIVAADAAPGKRDLRLVTSQGASNPLVFCVGQVPETCRKPMRTSALQVLGKEYLAQRVRPDDEVEMRIPMPCVMNGQVASGEQNRYRFTARKGQRLAISCLARELIPYIADAVPGWFQPVIVLYDARGDEVAYDDDYRFKPDPFISFQVPQDGEYVLAIFDAIYRGREDFIYRLTVGELPFITSIFPLGGRVGAAHKIGMKGWHLDGAELVPPPEGAGPGIRRIQARKGDLTTNAVPFMLDTLPEAFDAEPNDDVTAAQEVRLPVIVNGRIDRADDRDVFRFAGKAGQKVVAEVYARRLDSPVDSVLSLTDASGEVLILSDDRSVMFDEGRGDQAASLKAPGLNTHQADSYIMFELPADGVYYAHMAETARKGGKEYGYRLRLSPPQPDFELRTVPSSITVRSKADAAVSVYALRKDGFDDPITLTFANAPEGLKTSKVWLDGDAKMARLGLKGGLPNAGLQELDLIVEGRAKTDRGEIVRRAVPSEDRMQAFLWRHLVPAEDGRLKAFLYDPSLRPSPKRVPKYESKLDRP